MIPFDARAKLATPSGQKELSIERLVPGDMLVDGRIQSHVVRHNEILTEVIIAPDATEEAIAIIGGRRNLRLLLAGGLPDPRSVGLTAKTVAGGLLDRLLRSLLGVEAKVRQYAEGSAFTRQVVDAVGMDGFNAVWTSPETLPSRAEIAIRRPSCPCAVRS